MSSPLPLPPPGFDQLSRAQKLDYIDELLDYCAPNEDEVPVPKWHLELIEERMARYREVGMEGTPWEEFKEELDDLVEQEKKRTVR